MTQEKVKITFNDGTSRILPVINIDNIRKMFGYNIQSITNIENKSESLIKKKSDFDKKKDKLIDAGFIFNEGLKIFKKDKQHITSEELENIKPMQLGKLIKKTN